MKPNENAGAVTEGLDPEKENEAAVDGGLVVEAAVVALNENIEEEVVAPESLLGMPKEKFDGDEVAGVELENENVEGGLEGVVPLPRKLKDGLEVSADLEPNWNFWSSSFSLLTLPALKAVVALVVSAAWLSSDAVEVLFASRSLKCFS